MYYIFVVSLHSFILSYQLTIFGSKLHLLLFFLFYYTFSSKSSSIVCRHTRTEGFGQHLFTILQLECQLHFLFRLYESGCQAEIRHCG